MRFIYVICLLSIVQFITAQASLKPYWQQKLKYKLTADVQPQDHTINGSLNLQYTNHSPDTLTFIWFHLWPNAYTNDKTALMKQLKQIRGRNKKLSAIKEYGSITGLNWKINNTAVQAEPHPEYTDVVKLLLPAPLPPNSSITITTPFKTKLPNYFSRSGFFENSMFIAQWYPKPAVYDSKGWHPMPYLDMGEFYSEFGQYNVAITIPENYVVAATGKLETEAELKAYKRIGLNNYRRLGSAIAEAEKNNDPNIRFQFESYKPITSESTKTLHYSIDSVHDFAIFTDPGFIINYDTIQMSSGRIVDAFSYYQRNRFSKWIHSIDDAKDAVRFYSSAVGEYPYSSVSLVQGSSNENSGGMEYPTLTLITMKEDSEESAMDAVFAHEIGHNWFCGVLASNERDHAWMDEGINSFFQFRYESMKNRSFTAFGKIPENVRQLSGELFESLMYQTIDRLPNPSAIDRPSQNFKQDEDYGTSIYIKAAAWMYALEKKLGKETFSKCIKAYFSKWQFRHPYPEDLQKVFEEASGQNLTDFFKQLYSKKQTFH
jgi:hypothetical protein